MVMFGKYTSVTLHVGGFKVYLHRTFSLHVFDDVKHNVSVKQCHVNISCQPALNSLIMLIDNLT